MRSLDAKYSLIDLGKMLTYPRPAGSKMEQVFIRKFIDPIKGMKHDTYGNRFIKIGDSSTAFTSHTDTVHEPKRLVKHVLIDDPAKEVEKFPDDKHYYYDKDMVPYRPFEVMKEEQRQYNKVHLQGKWTKKKDSDVLGADDTTGVWLMLNMIHDKKPGLYIFHRDEEIGRFGSEHIAERNPKLLKGIKRVISFDRKGYSDIITHQMGERTASDKFARSLSKELGGSFRPDDTGSYTDSYSYRGIVPECTNISIGYKDAHTQYERQNLRFAGHLLRRIREVDFDKLPAVRKPEKETYVVQPRTYHWDDYFQSDNYKKYKNRKERRREERKVKEVQDGDTTFHVLEYKEPQTEEDYYDWFNKKYPKKIEDDNETEYEKWLRLKKKGKI